MLNRCCSLARLFTNCSLYYCQIIPFIIVMLVSLLHCGSGRVAVDTADWLNSNHLKSIYCEEGTCECIE